MIAGGGQITPRRFWLLVNLDRSGRAVDRPACRRAGHTSPRASRSIISPCGPKLPLIVRQSPASRAWSCSQRAATPHPFEPLVGEIVNHAHEANSGDADSNHWWRTSGGNLWVKSRCQPRGSGWFTEYTIAGQRPADRLGDSFFELEFGRFSPVASGAAFDFTRGGGAC